MTHSDRPSGEERPLRCAYCGRPINRAGNWADGPRYKHTGVNGSDAAHCNHAVRPMEPGEEPVRRLDANAQRAALEDALQVAWNDWCSDTGCIPDGFSIHGPRTTRVEADFSKGNFMGHVTSWLNAKGFDVVQSGSRVPDADPR